MNRIFFAIAVLLTLPACDFWGKYVGGVDSIDCTYTNYVGTRIDNQTNQPVSLEFCSDSYHLANSAQIASPTPGAANFSVNVFQYTKKTGGMAGDNCQDRGVIGNQVGPMFPLLSTADQVNYKLCFVPGHQPTNYLEYYVLIPAADACPSGSNPYDQNSVVCK